MSGSKIRRTIWLLVIGTTLACAGAANAATVYIVGDSDIGALNTKTGAAIAGSPFGSMDCPDLPTINRAKTLLFAPDECDDSIWVFKINKKTKALTAVPGSPFPSGTGNFAVQQAVVSKGGKFLYVSEDGSSVLGFSIAKSGALAPIAGSPFAAGGEDEGLVIHPSGRFVYAIDGLETGGTVTGFSVNKKTGALAPIAGSPFAAGDGIKYAAITRNGKFLYITQPGAEPAQVLGFAVNSKTGALTMVPGSPFALVLDGANPNGIATDGKFVYVADSADSDSFGEPGDISAFVINKKTGALTPVAGSPFTGVTNPKWVAIDPSKKLLLATNEDQDNMSVFSINRKTGVLTPVVGSPFPTNVGSEGMAFGK